MYTLNLHKHSKAPIHTPNLQVLPPKAAEGRAMEPSPGSPSSCLQYQGLWWGVHRLSPRCEISPRSKQSHGEGQMSSLAELSPQTGAQQFPGDPLTCGSPKGMALPWSRTRTRRAPVTEGSTAPQNLPPAEIGMLCSSRGPGPSTLSQVQVLGLTGLGNSPSPCWKPQFLPSSSSWMRLPHANHTSLSKPSAPAGNSPLGSTLGDPSGKGRARKVMGWSF